jgi:hypothetical protein
LSVQPQEDRRRILVDLFEQLVERPGRVRLEEMPTPFAVGAREVPAILGRLEPRHAAP